MGEVAGDARGATSVPPVAYVMTHYPRTALTFIALEIRELERAGVRVVPISINSVAEAELATPALRAAGARTTYLKAIGTRRLVATALRTAIRHPRGMANLVRIAITSSRLDLPLLCRRLGHLVFAATAARSAQTDRVRHFHAHFGQAPATVAWFAAEIASLATGERCAWSFTIHGFQDFADEHITRLDLKARAAAFVCCVSDYTKAQLCRVTDLDLWSRYEIVRCGIDLETFPYRPPATTCARLRVVTVARLSPEKGHLVLLDALRMLRERGLDIDLQIIGDGPSSELIERTAAQLGLADRVRLRGELDSQAVAHELAQSDVFCLPSFAEGIPVSIMEAMAIGLPVVTTFVGGIPELAVDGETALVVPASNAEALAEAIGRLGADPALRVRLAEGGRRHVIASHDVRRNADALRRRFQAEHRG